MNWIKNKLKIVIPLTIVIFLDLNLVLDYYYIIQILLKMAFF